MIEFSCKNCGSKLNVEDKHSGKRVRCPKCGDASVVPDASILPRTDDDVYQEELEEYEESVGVDRRIIVGIAAAAAAVIAGLIILAAVLRSSPPSLSDAGASLTKFQIDRVQKFAELYMSLLKDYEIDEAHQLHSPGFTGPACKSLIALFSRQINTSKMTRMDCTRIHCEPQPEEDHILLWYRLRHKKGSQALILSVIRIQQELMIDGIATWRSPNRPFISEWFRLHHPFSAGPKTHAALHTAVTAEYEEFNTSLRGKFSKHYKACGSVLLVLAGIAALMYIVYGSTAKRPGTEHERFDRSLRGKFSRRYKECIA